MIKLVIFDQDGVLLKIKEYFSDAFSKRYSILANEVLKVLLPTLAVAGNSAEGTFKYWKDSLDRWGVHLSEKDFFQYWFDSEDTKPVEENMAVAKELKHMGYSVVSLGDQFIERVAYFKEEFPILSEFDGAYHSSEVGYTKKEPKAFKGF